MDADIGTICVSTEGEQGGRRRPPPLPPFSSSTPTEGCCETASYKFRKTRNLDKIILNFSKFCEIQGKFGKTRLWIFRKKFAKLRKTKFFAVTLLLHNQQSAAQTPIC